MTVEWSLVVSSIVVDPGVLVMGFVDALIPAVGVTPQLATSISAVDLTTVSNARAKLSVLATNVWIAGSEFNFFSFSSSTRKDCIKPSKYERRSKCCWTFAQSGTKNDSK